MCKSETSVKRSRSRLLLSLESYNSNNDDDENGQSPPFASCALTGALILVVLVAIEQTCRYLFAQNQHWHVLLENETNRQILARHLGVDAVSCAVCAALGWASRSTSLHKIFNWQQPIPKAGYEQRLFTYNAAGFRVALFFFMYQVKNLVDTINWNDGPEFIFHHVFSLITAWGAMTPGCGHMYALFFFGLSEISTAVLCILANFDDEHGVVGLGDALPTAKIILGAAFVICFIVCRCILWPIVSYYFSRDILLALRGTDARAVHRRVWMIFFLVSLTGLSVLQVAWLGQIFVIAKEEWAKFVKQG